MKTTHLVTKSSLIGLVVAIATLGLTSGLAQAQQVTLQAGGNTNLYTSENLTFGGNKKESTPATLGAGNYKESATGASFYVYCLDPLTFLGNPLTYTKLTGSGNAALSTFITAGTATDSVNSYTEQFSKGDYTAVNNATPASSYDDQTTVAGASRVLSKVTELFNYAYADATNTGSAIKSAAFQYALWEILGDTKAGTSAGTWVDYNSASGGLREGTIASATAVNTSLQAQVNTYLTALNTGVWGSVGSFTNYTFTVYNSSASQTLVSVTQAGNKVPEPGSLALAGLAFAGLAFTRRQSKRKS